MCTNSYRKIVGYPKERLVLIAARSTRTLEELDLPQISSTCRWEVAREFDFKNIQDVLSAVEELNPFQCKGFVVVDVKTHLRASVVSSKYLAASASSGWFNRGFGPFNLGLASAMEIS